MEPRGLCWALEREVLVGTREMLIRDKGDAQCEDARHSRRNTRFQGFCRDSQKAHPGVSPQWGLGRAGARMGVFSPPSTLGTSHPPHPRRAARLPPAPIPERHAASPQPLPLPRAHPGEAAAVLAALGFPSTEGGVEKNASIIELGRREPAASPLLMPLR